MNSTFNKIIGFVFGLIFLTCQSTSHSNQWTVSSPDGKIEFQLSFSNDSLQEHCLFYEIHYEKKPVIPPSPLGIKRADQQFVEKLRFVSESGLKQVNESYALIHGKRRQCHNQANELTVTFQNQNNALLQIRVRAFNDGIAFKYCFPEEDDQNNYTVNEELTSYQIPVNGVAFMQPYDEPTQWTPAYEAYFQEINIGTASPIKAGWSFPALFHLNEGDYWLLLTEAGLDGSYHGSRLAQSAPNGLYRLRMPDPNDGNAVGAVQPTHTLPWETPWRVIMIATSLKPIVESSLITHLNPPAQIKNTEWIKPGRVSWSWWSEQDSPKKPDRLQAFVDLAVEMGWEYSLVDANWNEIPPEKLQQLADYAREKGIGLLFWYNSGGEHNTVTEAPRNRMSDPERRRQEFAWLKQIGASGVKVDFFHSDKQNIIQHYLNILKDAAEYQLMVNFHGCTLPRGWSRTYPHVMSMEAVRGAECYIFDATYPEKSPWHNTVLPFTRNVVGPMDYTPVAFSDNNHAHLTTNGHELALAVVFESGWQHFADRVEAYQNLPPLPKQFLQAIPTAWDEIQFLDGEPGKFVILARQKDDRWYLGGINGQNQVCDLSLSLDFLPEGRYQMTLIGDGEQARSFAVTESEISLPVVLPIKMQVYGGFMACFVQAALSDEK